MIGPVHSINYVTSILRCLAKERGSAGEDKQLTLGPYPDTAWEFHGGSRGVFPLVAGGGSQHQDSRGRMGRAGRSRKARVRSKLLGALFGLGPALCFPHARPMGCVAS